MANYLVLSGEWCLLVNDFKDAEMKNKIPHSITEDLARKILRFIRLVKLKQPNLFHEHRGEEYEIFMKRMTDEFPEQLVTRMVSDEDFWETTWELAKYR